MQIVKGSFASFSSAQFQRFWLSVPHILTLLPQCSFCQKLHAHKTRINKILCSKARQKHHGKSFHSCLTSRVSRCASTSASMSTKLCPQVLTHGTSNQHACSAERPSMVEMQHPKGCCVELVNWSIKNQLGSTNSKGLPVLFQGSHQGMLPNDHCLL